ncbi:MAG: patatin-like phospholipase family protein [Treponemataceae bacterium]
MKWALVLSGGGAKGFAYIGMLRAFEALNVPEPDLIIGCSIGAVLGSMLALGITNQEIERIFASDFDAEDYLGSGKVVPLKIVNRVLSFSSVFSNLLTSNCMDDGQKFYALLQKITEGKSFSETKIPFVCNAVDLYTGEEVFIKDGELAKAVLASSAFPVAFPPVRMGNKLLVDGGLAHNTPVCFAREMGFEEIFAVTLDHFRPESFPEKYPSALSIMARVIACVFKNKELQPEDYPSFWLDLSNTVSSADFSHANELIRIGYIQTMQMKNEIKDFFSDSLSAHKARKKIRAKIEKEFKV